MKEEGEKDASGVTRFTLVLHLSLMSWPTSLFFCVLFSLEKREEDPGSRFGLKRKLLRCLNLNRDPEEEVY